MPDERLSAGPSDGLPPEHGGLYSTAPRSTPPAPALTRRLQALRQAGDIPDPREAQITCVKTENAKLRERLDRSKQTVDELTDVHTQALARIAAQ